MSVHNAIRFIRANKKCSTQLAALTNSTKNTACNQSKGIFFLNFKSAHSERFFLCSFLVFLCLSLLFSTPSQAQAATAPDCTITSDSETVEINHVIDGDTVILKDGRHVRLIGIDTPEIGRQGKASDAGAEAARKYLLSLLHGHTKILLKYDAQRFDRFKRTLAHLFLSNDLNIQAKLLSAGLATPLNIPPNLGFVDCYLYHSNQAIADQQGLWALDDYQTIATTDLKQKAAWNNNSRHYRVVYGKVERVNESRSAIWINLEGNVALRIKREDFAYVDTSELQHIQGKTIQARGWVYKKNNQFRIRIRHRSDMILLK